MFHGLLLVNHESRLTNEYRKPSGKNGYRLEKGVDVKVANCLVGRCGLQKYTVRVKALLFST